MNSTLPIPTTLSTLTDALDAWQDWSDVTFDDKYREAILTLVVGVAMLTGYLVGFGYHWLLLQLVKTVRYWLEEAVQAVPVLYGWWAAPFIETQATHYPESCWQVLAESFQGRIAPAALAAILDYELDWAWAAEPLK